jgi:hypothetical protein
MIPVQVLSRLIESKELFVPLIFTEKQMIILEKVSKKKKLTNSEKKQLYTSIKAKLKALSTLETPTTYFLTADKPIPERITTAEKILRSLPFEKVFISGSFLFKKEYNDIDVFIISNKRGEEKKDNLHIIYIPEKALKTATIQSAARSSLSKFFIPRENITITKSLFDYMQLFQETSLLIFQNKDEIKDIRELIFYHNYLKYNNIPSSEQLMELCDEFMKLDKKKKLERIKAIIKDMLAFYGKEYLKRELNEYVGVLDNEIKEFRLNKHLNYYKETYLEALV